jgi:Mrp family chromosome partitioning ATPase/capsular polysaccharide biosynthesis protein
MTTAAGSLITSGFVEEAKYIAVSPEAVREREMWRETAGRHERSLHDYLRVARRRKWIILLSLVVVPIGAALFSLHQQRMYSSHAEVLLNRGSLANTLTGTVDPSIYVQADHVAQTQADLARVPAVAQAALAAAGVRRTPADLLSQSSVSIKQNADLLDFVVSDRDPVVAMALATDYARAYVAYRATLDTASLQRARREVQQRISSLSGSDSVLHRTLVEKDQQLATMEALQGSNASVVQAADRTVLVQPRLVRNTVLGFAFGLLVGIGLAFLWEALDTRINNANEIEALLDRPLLGRLAAPNRSLRAEDSLVMLADPRDVGAEAFRMLRTNFDFVRLGQDVKTIMFTSSVASEGKSTTVANLAVALATAGRRVALVDLDLRRPYLWRFFDLGGVPGITQVALGEVPLAAAARSVPLPRVSLPYPPGSANGNGNGGGTHRGALFVFGTGPVPPNVGEFVGSKVVAAIINSIRESVDVVLIDAPPLLQVGDAQALSRSVDGIVVITRIGVVRRPMLVELRRTLDLSSARVLGFVATGAEHEDIYEYGYGYGYGYSEARSTAREGMAAAEAVAR